MTAHSEAQIRYQKNHKEKFKAQSMARRYPHLLIVLYECLHRNRSKENHHPDYSKWRRVFRVCSECHHKIHPQKGRPSRGIMEARKRREKQESLEKSLALILAKHEMARRIKEIREKNNLSMYGLASLIKCTTTVVSGWEREKHYPLEHQIKKNRGSCLKEKGKRPYAQYGIEKISRRKTKHFNYGNPYEQGCLKGRSQA